MILLVYLKFNQGQTKVETPILVQSVAFLGPVLTLLEPDFKNPTKFLNLL